MGPAELWRRVASYKHGQVDTTTDEHLASGRETAAYAAGIKWLRTLVILSALALGALVNGDGLVSTMRNMLATGGGTDWIVFVNAAGTTPFAQAGWHWSPIAAWLFVPLAPMGLRVWQLLHVAALGLLPGWRLRIGLLLAWPFWWDVSAGNIMVFIFVAAYWMLRRNPVGVLLTLEFALLVPRPLEIPLVALVLRRQPEWRARFVVLAVINAGLILASGQAGAFAERLLNVGTSDITLWANVAPSAFVGVAWMLVGIPLAVLVFRRGHVGVASLLANPYWLPYYLLIPLLDLPAVRSGRDDRVEPIEGGRNAGDPMATLRRLGSISAVKPVRTNWTIRNLMGLLSDETRDRWRRWVVPAMILGIIAAIFPGHASAVVSVAWVGLAVLVVVSLCYWTWCIAREMRSHSTPPVRASVPTPATGPRRALGASLDAPASLARYGALLIGAVAGRGRIGSRVTVLAVALLALGLVVPTWHVAIVVWFVLAILFVDAEMASHTR